MATLKIKKGDLVQMLTGKDRGKQGRVIESRPKERRVVVENLNIVKKHQRPRPVRGTCISDRPSSSFRRPRSSSEYSCLSRGL